MTDQTIRREHKDLTTGFPIREKRRGAIATLVALVWANRL